MKNKIKKTSMLLIAILLCSSNIKALADTSVYYFNFQAAVITDLTKRTMKSGGASYEKFYYVTPTYFSQTESYMITPYIIETESERYAVGQPAIIQYYDENSTKRIDYFSTHAIPAGKYYYLSSRRVDGPVSTVFHAEGRYTP